MVPIIDLSKLTLVFENYDRDAQNLYESFEMAGIPVNVFVMNDNGFLPQNFISAYSYFLGDFSKSKNCQGRPLYFNQVQVPKYWEISGNNGCGYVHDYERLAANICFANVPGKRLVSQVDWLDEKGIVRNTEHFNQYGALYKKTFFNQKGERVYESYYDVNGNTVIDENLVTEDLIVHLNGKDKILHTRLAFYQYFFALTGLDQCRLVIPDLSWPFLLSEALTPNDKTDILFWHEDIGDSIPANMQMILDGTSKRVGHIFVQRIDAYNRLLEFGVSKEIIEHLGYCYRFVRQNRNSMEALICTNSDQILEIHSIVDANPDIHFSICAYTEMSSKLENLEDFENVSLYPNVKPKVLDDLFEKADIYLDINLQDEIADAVHRAFLNNMLILGFDETLHNKQYIAKTNVLPKGQEEHLKDMLTMLSQAPELFEMALDRQREDAQSESAKSFKAAFS